MRKSITHVCARCGRSKYEPSIRKCHDPAVKRILGEYICYDCCKKCKHHTKTPYCGAIGCDYTDK